MRVHNKSEPRSHEPLTDSALRELALAYVARYATTQARLRAYLSRKVRERGWTVTDVSTGTGMGRQLAEEAAPDEPGENYGDAQEAIDAILRRMAQAGYVDDEGWARMRTQALLRRGYGARRVDMALQAAGVGAGERDPADLGCAAQRRAALVLARRRRFGPFASADLPDRERREKQIAAMLRAGHPLDIARLIVDAPDIETVESWADSAEGDETCA